MLAMALLLPGGGVLTRRLWRAVLAGAQSTVSLLTSSLAPRELALSCKVCT